MAAIYVGYGLVEAAHFYISVEPDRSTDEHGWLDAELYTAWRSAQLVYDALTREVNDALQGR